MTDQRLSWFFHYLSETKILVLFMAVACIAKKSWRESSEHILLKLTEREAYCYPKEKLSTCTVEK